MSRVRPFVRSSWFPVILFTTLLTSLSSPADAQSYKVLSDFGEQSEGWTPSAGLVKASDGHFYGTTENGGYGYGTIFKVTAAGVHTTLHRFNYTDGGSPKGKLIQIGGALYGTAAYGGTANAGTIFEFDLASHTLAVLHSFDYADGHHPFAGVTRGSDGALYGTTISSPSGYGTIYRWSRDESPQFSVLHAFDYSNGGSPYGGVIEHSPGVLYGTTWYGGASGAGTLYKYETATDTHTILNAFSWTDGAYLYAPLLKAADGKLYGLTTSGGSNGTGTIFSWNPATNSFSTVHSFAGYDSTGTYPEGYSAQAPLIQAADGRLYGTTVYGGANNKGTIFRFAPGASTPLTSLHSFTGADGAQPQAPLVEGIAGTFFGVAAAAGSGGSSGTIFRFKPGATPSLVTLHTFEGSPANPDSPLVQAADGTLYGATRNGGASGGGTLFKVDVAGIVTTLHSFGTTGDGYVPAGDLVLDSTAGVLYGTTQNGGSGYGTIYAYRLATGVISVEHNFSGTDGYQPQGGLIRGSDGFLYGTTTHGGADSGVWGYGHGTVFKFDPNPAASSRLTVLKSFTYDSAAELYRDGYFPYPGLVEGTPGTFYGVASYAGSTKNSYGTVFRITSAGVFTKLHEFVQDTATGVYPTGAYPNGGLVKGADGHLYGTTSTGGTGHGGTLWRLTAAGAFSVMHHFASAEGYSPWARLVRTPDGALFGSTTGGGANGLGSVFRYDPAANAVSHVHAIGPWDSDRSIYPEGYQLLQALTVGSDGKLYGATYQGGRAHRGVVFSFDPPPTVRVLRANGGEKLFTGTAYTIQWTASDNGPLASFDVFFSSDGGATFGSTPICAGVTGAVRSCTWSTPVETAEGRFRVVAKDASGGIMSDESDANFTVVAGTGAVTVTAPNTAVTWNVGTAQTITWTHNLGTASTVNVAVSRDGGATFATIATDVATGSYVWTVAEPVTTQARIRVSWTNGPAAADQSDVNFTIAKAPVGCCVTVTQPNKKLINYGIGSTQQIKWTHTLGAGSSVKIELSRDGGATYPEIIAASVANTSATAGSYNWVVSGPATPSARIRITSTSGTAVDVNDINFTIAPAFLKLTPIVSWGYGTLQKVAWTTNLGLLDKVRVQLSQDGGATFTTVVASGIAGKRSANVSAPTLPSPIATARVKVVWTSAPEGFAAEDTTANFRIEPPFVTVTSPNGGEVWGPGKRTFVWSSNLGILEKVNILLSKDSGVTFPTTLVANTPSDGKHPVTVLSSWSTTAGRLRIVWVKNAAVADNSNADFTFTP